VEETPDLGGRRGHSYRGEGENFGILHRRSGDEKRGGLKQINKIAQQGTRTSISQKKEEQVPSGEKG